jgi:hypothetical protein
VDTFTLAAYFTMADTPDSEKTKKKWVDSRFFPTYSPAMQGLAAGQGTKSALPPFKSPSEETPGAAAPPAPKTPRAKITAAERWFHVVGAPSNEQWRDLLLGKPESNANPGDETQPPHKGGHSR